MVVALEIFVQEVGLDKQAGMSHVSFLGVYILKRRCADEAESNSHPVSGTTIPPAVRKELDRLYNELHATAQTEAARRESKELSEARTQVKDLGTRVGVLIDQSASHAAAMETLRLDHQRELAKLKMDLMTQEERASKAETELAAYKDRWDKYVRECEDLKEAHRVEELEAERRRAERIALFERLQKLETLSQK